LTIGNCPRKIDEYLAMVNPQLLQRPKAMFERARLFRLDKGRLHYFNRKKGLLVENPIKLAINRATLLKAILGK
jgi:hypothetical protein